MAYRGPQKWLKKYSKFRQPSHIFPKEKKKFQRQISRLAFEHPIFQFLSLSSLPYICLGGIRWWWIFTSSFVLMNIKEDSSSVRGRWSPSEPIRRFFDSVSLPFLSNLLQMFFSTPFYTGFDQKIPQSIAFIFLLPKYIILSKDLHLKNQYL